MNEERRIAKEEGIESPIWDSIEDTHKNYNTNLVLILNNLTKPKDTVFCGSHNQDSVDLIRKTAESLGIKSDGRVRIAQLKGFSDHLTGSLANEGFWVYKYLPYGTTESVMPYLIRRGQESRQVLREQKFQNEFLKREIKLRLKLSK